MNYEKHYLALIANATIAMPVKDIDLGVYTEIHHVIPRCLGGNDDPSNLVCLTAQEHFIAHALLVRMFPNESKLLYAYDEMRFARLESVIGKVNNKLFARIKSEQFRLLKDMVIDEHGRDIWTRIQFEAFRRRDPSSKNEKEHVVQVITEVFDCTQDELQCCIIDAIASKKQSMTPQSIINRRLHYLEIKNRRKKCRATAKANATKAAKAKAFLALGESEQREYLKAK